MAERDGIDRRLTAEEVAFLRQLPAEAAPRGRRRRRSRSPRSTRTTIRMAWSSGSFKGLRPPVVGADHAFGNTLSVVPETASSTTETDIDEHGPLGFPGLGPRAYRGRLRSP